MNICWVTSLTDDTLHKTSQMEIASELRKLGNKITIVMTRKIGEKKSINLDNIYLPSVHYSLLSVPFFGIIVFCLPWLIRNKKFDVFIIDGATVWLPFVLSLKLFRIPIILDIRTLPIKKENSILFDISMYLCRYTVQGLTTITPELKEILISKYNLPDKNIEIWSSGVSLETFSPPEIIDEKIEQLKNQKKFILMYHGSYSTARGLENLIKSIGHLNEEIRKEILLLIIGFNINEKEILIKLCEKLEVTEQIKFIPQVKYNEIPAYISITDVGAYPLPPEDKRWHVSAPLKTLEYLAMKKPVIVTNIPFHQRIFEKGECGVILDTNDPKDLAKAIKYLYNNKDKLTKMGNQGREIVEKYHTWSNSALTLEKFLKSIIESNKNEK